MKTPEIRRRLVAIGSAARSGDFEAAASHERQMFVEVLQAVAENKAGPVEAAVALASLGLEFTRAQG